MENVFINRDLENAIEDNISYFPVITITGPRQSGKTTLIRKCFPDMPYYSLENLDIRNAAQNDPVGFLMAEGNGMILDEVQRVPELLSYLQGVVDETPKHRYVLSGSSQFGLLSSITQSLAGRSAVLELLPLSVHEYSDPESDIYSTMIDGFYPAIAAKKNVARLFYPAYVKTYLERDVRQLLNVENMHAFQVFLKLCAGRIGSLFNASELANEVGVSSNTIKSWLSVLQASYIVTLLPPYFANMRKRLTKTPKLYFYDTGLAAYLLGINSPEQLVNDRMRGHLFENYLIMDVLKNRYNKGLGNDLLFYRDAKGNEVDLLIPEGPKYRAIEIKSSMTYNTDFEKSFKTLPEELDQQIVSRSIVYNGSFEMPSAHIALLNHKTFLQSL